MNLDMKFVTIALGMVISIAIWFIGMEFKSLQVIDYRINLADQFVSIHVKQDFFFHILSRELSINLYQPNLLAITEENLDAYIDEARVITCNLSMDNRLGVMDIVMADFESWLKINSGI